MFPYSLPDLCTIFGWMLLHHLSWEVITFLEFFPVGLQIKSKDKRYLAGDLKCRKGATNIHFFFFSFSHSVDTREIRTRVVVRTGFFFSAGSPCSQEAAAGHMTPSETTISSGSSAKSYTRYIFSSMTRVPAFPQRNLNHWSWWIGGGKKLM